MTNKDFIIILAWPEGMVTASGAWYDKIISTNGKYRVGHSALILVDYSTGKLHYFDFGRYHTSNGYGRIRDTETDPDVEIKQLAIIKNNEIKNIENLLIEKIQSEEVEKAWADALNKGINLPFLNEAQEQKVFEEIIDKGTDIIAGVMRTMLKKV